MFNKAIFKQTVKQNRTLWLIVTAVLTLIMVLVITQFDPTAMQNMADMAEISGILSEVGFSGMAGSTTTLIGILSLSFYGLIALIMILVYIIITSNNLIAGEVDRGSMAYTLSTPIKRSTVIFTKAFYLVSSLLLMIVVFVVAGLASVQLFTSNQLHVGKNYSNDVREIAKNSDYTNKELDDQLWIILENDKYFTMGMEKKNTKEEIYTQYLESKIDQKGIEAAAAALGLTVKEVEQDYELILNSPAALKAGAEATNTKLISEYYLVIVMKNEMSKMDEGLAASYSSAMQAAFKASAAYIHKDLMEAYANLELIIYNEDAVKAGTKAANESMKGENGIIFTDEMIRDSYISMAANKLATNDVTSAFDVNKFLLLNLGLFLLVFATSGISFIASSIFNLSKHSFALGAGVPLLFFVFQLVSGIDESLDWFRYLTINTLFDVNKIRAGSSVVVPFAALALIGLVLYPLSISIFKRKDLPL